MASTYRDLRVWQNAMDLAVSIYKVTEAFPKHEQFGLTAQLRRAAVSIPSNIGEGKERHTDKEFTQFLLHARGSLLELETQLELAERLAYLPKSAFRELDVTCAQIGSSLAGLINAMRKGVANDRRPKTND